MIDSAAICEKVLMRLSKMDYEKTCYDSEDRLIFPKKDQAKGFVDRISEQELRHIFIEEFKEKYDHLYYSIETPTIQKYNFKDLYKETKDIIKQSALHDMCVFEKIDNKFNRIFNIEFKHKMALKSIEKDILKLIFEDQSGAFIFLVKNTDKRTLNNISEKLSISMDRHKKNWKGQKNKFLHIIILSLEVKRNKGGVPFLKHLKIYEHDLKTIKEYNYEWI